MHCIEGSRNAECAGFRKCNFKRMTEVRDEWKRLGQETKASWVVLSFTPSVIKAKKAGLLLLVLCCMQYIITAIVTPFTLFSYLQSYKLELPKALYLPPKSKVPAHGCFPTASPLL